MACLEKALVWQISPRVSAPWQPHPQFLPMMSLPPGVHLELWSDARGDGRTEVMAEGHQQLYTGHVFKGLRDHSPFSSTSWS